MTSTCNIPLSQGKVAIVDAADYEALSQFKWHARGEELTFYAARNLLLPNGKRGIVLMHRAIMNPAPERFIDHVNHDGLDNRRANLRDCSKGENQRNTTSRRGSSSQFLGVGWDANNSKWRAKIEINGRQFHLGRYADETEAARAYDAAAVKYHGQFANPNFPQEQAA